jgi:hypothetical protein
LQKINIDDDEVDDDDALMSISSDSSDSSVDIVEFVVGKTHAPYGSRTPPSSGIHLLHSFVI